MKNLLIILLLTPFISYSQDFKIGLKVSREVTLPSVQTVQENRGFSSMGSTNFGLQVIKEFNGHVGIETGLYLYRRNFTDNKEDKRLSYKAVPVMLRFSGKRFYFSVGPQLEFFHSQGSKGVSKEDSEFSLSVAANIGYSIDVSEKTSLYIETRGNLSTKEPYADSKILLFNLGLGLGVNFVL